jgi:SAM-dependent methyltransferase
MNQQHLEFPNSSFDLVINRQAPFTISEIVRVVKEEGYFITQQVAETNMLNILSEFGWDISALPQSQNFSAVISQFELLNCRVVAQAEYNVRYFVKDLESLIFWLKALLHKSATGFPESFDLDKHWLVIERIVSKYQTQRGIETNEHRRLLIVQKNQNQPTTDSTINRHP